MLKKKMQKGKKYEKNAYLGNGSKKNRCEKKNAKKKKIETIINNIDFVWQA